MPNASEIERQDQEASVPGFVNYQEAVGSVEQTLAEHEGRYGDFTDHAALTDGLVNIVQQAPGWSGALRPVHRQAIRVIFDKIARVVNGDPEYLGNWHDIQGYAKLAEDRSFGERDVDRG